MSDTALREILDSHGSESGSLVPVLQEIQGKYGYLPAEAMIEVAKRLRVDEATVYSVATFYAQFKLVPTGKHQVKVCCGTACHVRGGSKILDAAERELGIGAGATTEDREYSLDRVACFGSCALAPVVVVDKDVYGRMTPSRVKSVLDDSVRGGQQE
ncbi:MAG: NADH-quinone oxidoreductase subunit NuoE [Chloroflexi bacterium]|nr:NADH-quinone oxidoreductase subunit NuoE [Chloroflexota bacterium]